jgi:hypothetical protein
VEPEDGNRSIAQRADERAQRFGAQQRRITKDNEKIVTAFKRGARGQYSVGRPAPFRLNEDVGGGREAADFSRDIIPARPDDDGSIIDPRATSGQQGMIDERLPGDAVQYLGRRGCHSRALAGGEHNRGSMRHWTSCGPGGRQRFSPWPPESIAAARFAPTLVNSRLD